MLDTKGKTLNLTQLSAELTAAGITHRGLGMAGRLLHTYQDTGEVADLPDTAAAVVTAHVPVPSAEEQADTAEKNQLASADADLAAYIAAASPTQAQTVIVVKLLARIARRMLRKVG